MQHKELTNSQERWITCFSELFDQFGIFSAFLWLHWHEQHLDSGQLRNILSANRNFDLLARLVHCKSVSLTWFRAYLVTLTNFYWVLAVIFFSAQHSALNSLYLHRRIEEILSKFSDFPVFVFLFTWKIWFSSLI